MFTSVSLRKLSFPKSLAFPSSTSVMVTFWASSVDWHSKYPTPDSALKTLLCPICRMWTLKLNWQYQFLYSIGYITDLVLALQKDSQFSPLPLNPLPTPLSFLTVALHKLKIQKVQCKLRVLLKVRLCWNWCKEIHFFRTNETSRMPVHLSFSTKWKTKITLHWWHLNPSDCVIQSSQDFEFWILQ